MNSSEPDTVIPALRQWLRNERRLGLPHYSAPIAHAARPVSAPPTAASTHAKDSRPPVVTATADMFADASDLPPLCTQELGPDEAAAALDQLDAEFVKPCTKCRLHEHRRQTVFGAGKSRPELVFVGEGPGADEDAQGVPFVGRAGQLLTRMIAAMTLTREQVYICNIVKCRPPGNRTPAEDEMQTCVPYLYRQLAILRPKVIIALGRPASQTLLATKVPIGKLRGEFHDYPPPTLAHLGLVPIRLMPTFHPAYLLRSPGEKAKSWADLQQVMGFLEIEAPRRT